MHLTTVYKPQPRALRSPTVQFYRHAQVTCPMNSINSVSLQTSSLSAQKVETAGEIFARIGLWEGEPLVQEPQGDLQERDELL